MIFLTEIFFFSVEKLRVKNSVLLFYRMQPHIKEIAVRFALVFLRVDKTVYIFH